MSKLILPATTQCVPDDFVTKIKKKFYRLLWRSHDKFSRNKVMQDINAYGGLNMINLQLFFNALKASWISRIQAADHNTCNLVQLPNIYLYKLDEQGLNFRLNLTKVWSLMMWRTYPVSTNRHLSTITRHLQVINKNLRKVLWANLYLAINL